MLNKHYRCINTVKSVWIVEFQDGSTMEFIDASRAEIQNYLGTKGRGYIKKITRVQ